VEWTKQTRTMTRRGEETERIAARFGNVVVLILIGMGGILMLLPFLWTFSTSFRLASKSFELPPQWLPTDFRTENYRVVFQDLPFVHFFLNSLFIASMITIGQLITCSMAAFAFARLRFPGRNALFLVLLSGLMVPIQVTIIPLFIVVRIFHLLNSPWALIVPSLISAFGVFLLRQFFLTIPQEIEDAAKMDGASPFTIYWRIMLPLAGPGLSTLGIFTFNAHWNEYFRPLLFLSKFDQMTLPVGLVILRGYFGSGNLSAILAGVTLAIIPVLIVFLLFQRFLVEGITLTGLKG